MADTKKLTLDIWLQGQMGSTYASIAELFGGLRSMTDPDHQLATTTESDTAENVSIAIKSILCAANVNKVHFCSILELVSRPPFFDDSRYRLMIRDALRSIAWSNIVRPFGNDIRDAYTGQLSKKLSDMNKIEPFTSLLDDAFPQIKFNKYGFGQIVWNTTFWIAACLSGFTLTGLDGTAGHFEQIARLTPQYIVLGELTDKPGEWLVWH